jgi:hypothetical protein
MLRFGGFNGEQGAHRFRMETLLDIASCDYRQFTRISRNINAERVKNDIKTI